MEMGNAVALQKKKTTSLEDCPATSALVILILWHFNTQIRYNIPS